MIRRTNEQDVDRVTEILDEAKNSLRELGIDQWQNGYPNRESVLDDIRAGRAFVVTAGGKIVATFAMALDGEPTYDRIYGGDWLTDSPFVVLHRVAVALDARGQGYAETILDFLDQTARENGLGSIRVDTHRGNVPMRRMLERNGFCYCGIIYLSDGGERVAYEKPLV